MPTFMLVSLFEIFYTYLLHAIGKDTEIFIESKVVQRKISNLECSLRFKIRRTVNSGADKCKIFQIVIQA